MQRAAPLAVTIAASLALAGCATTSGGALGGGTDVTRYHLGQQLPAGSVAVEPLTQGTITGPEFLSYADAVAVELGRLGFAPSVGTAAPSSQYIASVGFQRQSRGAVRTPPKFSIGLGGGGFTGGGLGLGGGVSTGIGSKTREVIVSELFVQLRRRSDGTIVWEGRAQTGGIGRGETQPGATAAKLANALFRGFPGESGVTIAVP